MLLPLPEEELLLSLGFSFPPLVQVCRAVVIVVVTAGVPVSLYGPVTVLLEQILNVLLSIEVLDHPVSEVLEWCGLQLDNLCDSLRLVNDLLLLRW